MMAYGYYMIGATLLVLLAEIVAGRHRGMHPANEKRVLWGAAISGIAIGRPLSALLLAWVMGIVGPGWRGQLAWMPLLPAYLLSLFVAEFCFYWVHRWAHEAARWKSPWLWRLHRTHHSAKYMSVLLTLRINAFWYFLVPTSWVLAITIYLGQEFAAALVSVTIYAWNLITHANFRWDDPIRRNRWTGPAFRVLEHVLVSPGIHHSHHGYGKDGGPFRNFAVTLSLYDWMFGTLHIPQGRPQRYGVPGKDPHWAEELFYPLVRARARSEG
jgi:sterol desaturase/sphingolipid hydroxylase (fatty acid hydroxylase superfamily)